MFIKSYMECPVIEGRNTLFGVSYWCHVFVYVVIYIYGRVPFNVSIGVARPRGKVPIPLGSKVPIPLGPESFHTFTGLKFPYLYSPGFGLDPHGT